MQTFPAKERYGIISFIAFEYAANIFEEEIDNMPVGGPGYQMFRQKNNERLQKLYAQIEDIDERIAVTTKKLSELADDESSLALFNEKLIDYEKLFATITPEEKKDFFKYFFKSITIYPDFEDATQIVKSVQIYFRAYKNQSELKEEILNAKSTKKVLELMNDESQVKTIYTEIDLQEFGLDKLLESRAKEALTLTYMPRSRKRGPYNSHKVTYKKIQQYVKEKNGFTAHTTYIAEVKRDFGCEMVEAYNAVEVLKHKKHHPTLQMREAITDALIHFGVISAEHEPQNFDVGEVTYKMIE